MKKQDKEIAVQSGLMHKYNYAYSKELQAFADLIRADEREECAKFIEPTEEHRRDALWGYVGGTEGVELLDGLAAAIRDRGKQ